MMKWLFAGLAGLMIGLLSLPVEFWWIGLGFPLATVWWLYKEPTPSQIFFFALTKTLTVFLWFYFWLATPNDDWLAGVTYLISSILLAIPLWLTLIFVFVLVEMIKADDESAILYRVLVFPLGYYLGQYFQFFQPIGEFPLLEASHQPWFRDFFSGAFPIIGSTAIEGFILAILLFFPLPLLLKVEGQRILPLPWLAFILLFGIHLVGGMPEKNGKSLTVMVLPWSGVLGTEPTAEELIQNYETRMQALGTQGYDLLVLPQGAIKQTLEIESAKRLIPSLAEGASLLYSEEAEGHQHSILLNKEENSILHLPNVKPLAFFEYHPVWVDWLQLPMGPGFHAAHPGELPTTQIKGQTFVVAHGEEQYIDSFYHDNLENAGWVVIQDNKSSLPLFGKQCLQQLGEAKALQSIKTVLIASNGGLSGVVGATLKGELPGEWIPQQIAGKYEVQTQERVSLFYRWGQWLSPLLILGLTGLFLSLAYQTYYKRG